MKTEDYFVAMVSTNGNYYWKTYKTLEHALTRKFPTGVIKTVSSGKEDLTVYHINAFELKENITRKATYITWLKKTNRFFWANDYHEMCSFLRKNDPDQINKPPVSIFDGIHLTEKLIEKYNTYLIYKYKSNLVKKKPCKKKPIPPKRRRSSTLSVSKPSNREIKENYYREIPVKPQKPSSTDKKPAIEAPELARAVRITANQYPSTNGLANSALSAHIAARINGVV